MRGDDLQGRPDVVVALDKIESERADSRHIACSALRKILLHNRQASTLKQIDDRGYHAILETVFRIVKLDLSLLAKASKHSLPKISTRLSASASLLRTVVEVGLSRLRARTVRAITEHVLQCVLASDGQYHDPLVFDYFKALAILLSHKAHVEHINDNDWQEIVDFCLARLRDLCAVKSTASNGSTSYHGSLSWRSSREAARQDSSIDAFPSFQNNINSQGFCFPKLQASSEDIVACLKGLTSSSRAPVLSRAKAILNEFLDLLRAYSHPTKIQQSSYNVLEQILSRTLTCDVETSLDALERFVPIVRKYWQRISTTQRESVLAIFLESEPLLLRLYKSASNDEILHPAALLQTLQEQYCARKVRDQLSLDDLIFLETKLDRGGKRESKMLGVGAGAIRQGCTKAEEPWSVIRLSAVLYTILEDQAKQRPKSAEGNSPPPSAKRHKHLSPLETLLQELKHQQSQNKIYALQVLSCLFDLHLPRAGLIESALECFTSLLTSEDTNVVNWTLFSLSSLALQAYATTQDLRKQWSQVWKLAHHNMGMSTSCRVACHLCSVLLRHQLVTSSVLADSTDSLPATGVMDGPAECDDSSTSFWYTVIEMKRRETLGLDFRLSKAVLRWLFESWNPASEDRTHLNYISRHSSPRKLAALLYLCLGKEMEFSREEAFTFPGKLSEARMRATKNSNLCTYLMKVYPGVGVLESRLKSRHSSTATEKSSSWETNPSLCQIVFDFLDKECLILNNTIKSFDSQTGAPIIGEAIGATAYLLVVCHSIIQSQNFPLGLVRSLIKSTGLLQETFVMVLQIHENRKELKQIFVSCLGPCLSSLDTSEDALDQVTIGLLALIQPLNKGFWTRNGLIAESTRNAEQEQDSMDMELEFTSQSTQQVEVGDNLNLIHLDSEGNTHAESSYMNITTHLYCLSKLYTSSGTRVPVTESLPLIVSYITGLSREDFLLSKNAIIGLLESDLEWLDDEADTVLQYIQQVIIKPYELENSEIAIVLGTKALTTFTDLWTGHTASDIAATGAELYAWFVQKLKHVTALSSVSLTSIAELMFKVMKASPDYARSLDLPSTRTTLLSILIEGDVNTKYFIGKRLHEVFNNFILNEHTPILEDIIEALPSDSDWVEGIALRLDILSNLGARWSTLLRRCTYAILETAGRVPLSAAHAALSIRKIAEHLGISSSSELFRLFASQLMFTWLDMQSLKHLPFAVFGYQSISSMLLDVQDEAVAQCMMRGNVDEIQSLQAILSKPANQLLEQSFAKTAAYSIARDIAWPPSNDPKALGAERRMRDLLGKTRFAELAGKYFASIVGILIQCSSQEGQIQKAFNKHTAYADAGAAYQQILDFGHSPVELPPGQQPAFKTKHLLDQIKHICHRASQAFEHTWSPSLVVHVFRQLLRTIKPALGSLHTCSVLRKIRILVSLAGTSIVQGYPLQMALHAIRPFLHDNHCADDCIGILRYLLEAGADHLVQRPRFVLGYAISTMVDLREFFQSEQDSTTQSDIFQATISKAQSYLEWLRLYLAQYDCGQLEESQRFTFRAIANAASHFGEVGNAIPGSHESDLLLAILADDAPKAALLSLACKKNVLKSISHEFHRPSSFRVDTLGDDTKAQRYAAALLNTCHWKVAGSNYLQWAARVLGRSYRSYGMKSMISTEEINAVPIISEKDQLESSPLSHSRIFIIRILDELLSSERRHEVGLAEDALRLVVTGCHSSRYEAEVHHVLDQDVYDALLFPHQNFRFQREVGSAPKSPTLAQLALPSDRDSGETWIKALSKILVDCESDDPLMDAIQPCLEEIEGIAQRFFPFILHLVLLSERNEGDTLKRQLSDVLCAVFNDSKDVDPGILKTLLSSYFYLRTQPLPRENVQSDRVGWLDLDLRRAALTAKQCSLYKTALLLLEIEQSEKMKNEASNRAKPRHSKDLVGLPSEALLSIYERLEDHDAYYGVQQPSTLSSVLAKLNHEQLGYKALSFQSAFFDCEVRRSDQGLNGMTSQSRMAQVLNDLNLHGLSETISHSTLQGDKDSLDAVMNSARKLEIWTMAPPSSHQSDTVDIFTTLRKISNAQGQSQVSEALESGFSACLERLLVNSAERTIPSDTLTALAILTEVEDVFTCEGYASLEDVMSRFAHRDSLLQVDSFSRVRALQSCRETMLVTLGKRGRLRDFLNITKREAYIVACKGLLASTMTSRKYGSLQDALSTVTYLSSLVTDWETPDLHLRAATNLEIANVLWSQDETTASVAILGELAQNLQNDSIPSQAIEVGKASLLAKLGNRTAQARLEKPEYIIDKILKLAIKELGKQTTGNEAGEVFHEFASFCDGQLQNTDSMADFERLRKLREHKKAEIEDLDQMIESARQIKEKENLEAHRKKAAQWFALDDQEYRRLESSRETLMGHSLSCYLQALRASDKYENDALRFSTLWLENRDHHLANEVVAQHLPQVPSRKFAPLINQWTSRLLDAEDQFQRLLFDVIVRICIEHPYHGMYQIFTGSKTKGGKDDVSLARHAAACNVVEKIKSVNHAHRIWLPIHNMAVAFVKFAQERDESIKPGTKVCLRKSQNGTRMAQDVSRFPIPPPTMVVELRADRNYSSVTMIAKFQPEFSTATGISAPKIVTAIGTDGLKYKQLLKSGHDDLRQDAIMEQVFAAVSSLMRIQKTTRQRNLSIRTYKVLPLTATAGIIEFVQNTVPLHDYLLPAHQRHFPKDLKPNTCRKHIQEAQKAPIERRIKTFQKVCEQFHPVLRYFFQEKFLSPDDWYAKRVAYTRSTAAISILGHILGLGDRHGHNILLDETTGEVVHIDLGIAFEQGRVLPVPEVVPFRLTRDLVDGMGITGTEGVFRRCCEFTLEALRNESYAIMSILDVLRYDPLYSWSLSPRRLMKMQEAQTENPAVKVEGGGPGKKMEEEAGEAERALLVVSKKLSPTLSVQATVNELIQQATDDKNLAVLFCGWAAYA